MTYKENRTHFRTLDGSPGTTFWSRSILLLAAFGCSRDRNCRRGLTLGSPSEDAARVIHGSHISGDVGTRPTPATWSPPARLLGTPSHITSVTTCNTRRLSQSENFHFTRADGNLFVDVEGCQSERRASRVAIKMDDREYELKQLELALKDREVTAREREVAAKDKESTSKWFNPLTIAIYVAAIGLFGNIWNNYSNNSAAARSERQHFQSDLAQSLIKTNGSDVDSCKNLYFFVRIGWLDDPNGTIHNVCGTKGEGGVPTLPPSGLTGIVSSGAPSGSPLGTVTIKVEDEDSHAPIENATVELTPLIWVGGSLSRLVATDAKGIATLNFTYSDDTLTVSKDGYEPRAVKPLSQLKSAQTQFSLSLPNPIFTIPLHRIPAAKK
jgi:hypothetical protein